VIRDEKADCKLEIPNAGDDDIGNYECGILEVTHVNSVNTVAKSQARRLVIVDETTQDPQGSNFQVGTAAGSAGGAGVVLAIIVLAAALVMTWAKRRQKHRDGGLQGEQDRGQQVEQGPSKGLQSVTNRLMLKPLLV